jgi:anti-sigma factor RsiW
MHPELELMQRLLHGELPAEAEPGMRAHLETCEECRRRAGGLRRAEAEQVELLRLLDHPAPGVTPVAIIARARNARRHER